MGLSIAALLVCVTDLIFTIMDKRTGKPQNKFYILIMTLLGVSAAHGVISAPLDYIKMTSESAFETLEVTRYLYFLAHSFIAPVFFFYISYVTGRSINRNICWRYNRTAKNIFTDLLPQIILVLTVIIIASNPFHHWVWYYDVQRDFRRGFGEFLLVYAQSAVWMIASFVLLMRSWNILSKNRKNAIAFCYLLVVLGIVIQLIFKNIRIEVLMETLGFTGVLLFVENEDERKDVEIAVYNSAAFSLDISAAIKNKTPVKVIIVRDIEIDLSSVPFVSGQTDTVSLSRTVADLLAEKVERYYIYSIGHRTFALTLYNKSDDEALKTANEIYERFEKIWDINGSDVYLDSAVMLIDIPERAKDINDIIYISECPIPENAKKGVMRGDDLNWIVRYSAVEAAVTRGLAEGSFEVYYQPTYNIDKTLYGAEALLRMHDKELGNIYPDEFIPIAEKLGLIDEIDSFVLEEVCRLLATGEPQKYGVGHINVNLSVIECMKDGFIDHIMKIVDKSGAEKHNICFEITESAAAADYEYLAQVIDELKNAGFLFYIDDFGTGYSNISSLFSLGADIIKIDKSVLWGAQKDELGMVLLSGTISMVKGMRKKTLCEGVETIEQLDLLKELGCNYLQGYYFAKPLPEGVFLEHIKSVS